MKPTISFWCRALVLALLMTACVSSPGAITSVAPTIERPVADTGAKSFGLYILHQNLPVTCYELEKCWPILKQANLNSNDFVISQDDIETYDWSSQTITLTSQATNQLNTHFSANPSNLGSNRVAFVVTLDGEWLYGGIFLDLSEQPYSFPLIFTDFSGTQAVFYLRPGALRRPVQDYQQYNASQRKIIEIGRVHDLFKGLGKLVE